MKSEDQNYPHCYTGSHAFVVVVCANIKQYQQMGFYVVSRANGNIFISQQLFAKYFKMCDQ